ncbi:MAG TPA: ParA family protein, partial [Anaerolineales bacterium]|nr:ParA family protein [Anaerolineales bacterium]
MATKILCIANQKGGVGKTTTTVNIGHGLARKGHNVLMIDLDPQGQVASVLNC